MTAKEENLPILKWMKEETNPSITDKDFDISFNIGPWYKSGFQIRVKGGFHTDDIVCSSLPHSKEVFSEPSTILNSLSEYESLTIEIYQFPSGLSIEDLNMKPLVMKDLDITINFDVIIAPNPVHPQEDSKFKDREWAKFFIRSATTAHIHSSISRAKVSPDLVCQIVRDCYAIYNMKAFW